MEEGDDVEVDSLVAGTRRTRQVFGELWEDKKARVRAASPFGHLPGWDLRSMIVKTGDDLRQELFAMQLVVIFKEIYVDAGLPLHLTTYGILVLSSDAGLIETVTNAMSISELKSKTNSPTLRDYFESTYGKSFREVQRNFVESMAAYSVLSHILQVKDRHNGNVMVTTTGQIIHIDYGFFLSNSPGGVSLEAPQFKCTREYLDVMDGENSDMFRYFQSLCCAFFIEARRHHKRILAPIEVRGGEA